MINLGAGISVLPKTPSPRSLQFSAGNYQSRTDGAVYVQLGEATVYFAALPVPIALATKGVVYCLDAHNNSIIYKRLRAVRNQHSKSRVHTVNRGDLLAMVEAAIMTMASNLIDERIRGR